MPNPIINKVSSTCNIPLERVEELWQKAEEIVLKQYGKKNSHNYSLITATFKHSLGKECNNSLGWKTKWNKKTILESIDMLIKHFNVL